MRADRVPVVLAIAALLVVSSCAFVHLMALPAFEDEGSQLGWIWRIIDAGEWLQPLADGKPLEAWPMVLLVRLGLPPLAGIRAVHVLAGMAGSLLTYGLALQVGGRAAALCSGLLFAICPFTVYLERLALSDTFLCTAGVWVLLSVLMFIRNPTRVRALQFALALLLAAFCKFPVGFVFLFALPLALVLIPASDRQSLVHAPASSRLLAAYTPVTALLLAVTAIAIYRLHHGASPGFGLQDLMGIALGRYSDIAAVIDIPRPSLVDELTTQLTRPVAIIALLGLLAAALRGDWRVRWLIGVGAIPALLIGYCTHFWYPRYLLFTIPPLIVASVLGWQAVAAGVAASLRRPLLVAVLVACAALMAHQSSLIVLRPLAARWSALDRFQYIEGWGSGYGYPEAATYVLHAAHAPAQIFSLDGHSAYQLLTYLPAAWRSRVRPVFYGSRQETLGSASARLNNLLIAAPAWLIVPEPLLNIYLNSTFGQTDFEQLRIREIATFDKPGSRARLAIYEVSRR
jgi:hypothetical protein